MKRWPITTAVLIGLVLSIFISPVVSAVSFPAIELADGTTLPGGGTLTVPLPTGSGGISAGDLLLVAIIADDNANPLECSTVGPQAWVSVDQTGIGAGYVILCARIATGSETVAQHSNPTGLIAGQSFRVVGWRGAPLGSGSVSGATVRAVGGAPNPPEHNPSGWDVEETLWIIGAAMANNAQGRDFTAGPISWTLIRYDDGTQQSIISHFKPEAVASQDAGAFVVTENPPSWQAYTLAVRPSATEPLVTLAATAIGFNRATMNGRLDVLFSGSADVWFEYGTTVSLGTESPHDTVEATGTFSIVVTGLTAETEYHFRAMSEEIPSGYDGEGEILTFMTGRSPLAGFEWLHNGGFGLILFAFFLIFLVMGAMMLRRWRRGE